MCCKNHRFNFLTIHITFDRWLGIFWIRILLWLDNSRRIDFELIKFNLCIRPSKNEELEIRKLLTTIANTPNIVPYKAIIENLHVDISILLRKCKYFSGYTYIQEASQMSGNTYIFALPLLFCLVRWGGGFTVHIKPSLLRMLLTSIMMRNGRYFWTTLGDQVLHKTQQEGSSNCEKTSLLHH